MIDTHCHLTYDPILSQLDAVLARAAAAGVERMISIGTSPDDARQSIALANAHPQIYSSVGLHPHHAAEWPDKAEFRAAVLALASHPKVLAIGETGLDRHYSEPSMEVQRQVFDWQLELAHQLNKPVVIHAREAIDDILPIVLASGIPASRFVFHCFTDSEAQLDRILETGAYVSFTGVVTFVNSAALAQASTKVPIDRIMIETDAPYLTPAPHRKIRVNEPCYVKFTAEKLAQMRNLPFDQFVAHTTANAERFFFNQ